MPPQSRGRARTHAHTHTHTHTITYASTITHARIHTDAHNTTLHNTHTHTHTHTHTPSHPLFTRTGRNETGDRTETLRREGFKPYLHAQRAVPPRWPTTAAAAAERGASGQQQQQQQQQQRADGVVDGCGQHPPASSPPGPDVSLVSVGTAGHGDTNTRT